MIGRGIVYMPQKKNVFEDLIKKKITFVVVEHKRQLMEDIVNKEIELELGMIR